MSPRSLRSQSEFQDIQDYYTEKPCLWWDKGEREKGKKEGKKRKKKRRKEGRENELGIMNSSKKWLTQGRLSHSDYYVAGMVMLPTAAQTPAPSRVLLLVKQEDLSLNC